MIQLKNISKHFGKLKALDGVTTICEKSECIALIGPNGCGKTTLIKTILGMVVPDSGSITFNGENILKHWQYRDQIGYMPQMGRYPDNMTIGQVLGMMKDIRGKSEGLDEDLIKAFSVQNLLNKRMGTLSGGTIQKVSAALAFLFNPSVLILDEPTAGLDPVASELFKEKILAEKDKGKLVLITSHILSDLDDLVTRIIYMQEGKLVFHKSIEELRQDTGEERLVKSIAQVMISNYE
ncbi:MAG: copper ABC transporter ATP-binding protein [Sphingobacteriales bacterium 17-39-43]|uniref:ABC transporter ATP-binding protein n=1 Tax=Daejeonella sp. TaxID=2805397 RepID=UPI000BD55624|nr:ABC transporter ATP-binding protein [Daejeonella sp.]OYZ31928.1 MAG: copper ABC transporter ATP-binding protein [Sphingobacteriales bacterium 16-39-50]OZA25234.1 MAG: copper ABC transporter ATP-binding protein [Sphingobacteriales bacterium 17-39-43]HQS52935.1 ABC transporter ATP-binding protein [Daejeonella sp.]HQT23676.1 ABC transporter ATP-binding protein [Daejeonella sp.]HQT58387.1 ABC transporter ATP-binding protein [Daejeonella sp.]